jgi:pimeloyl-ACP methyl ester carboxylesterase
MNKLIITIAFAMWQSLALGQAAFKVERTGKGDPILFLPGFTCPGSVWNETIDHLEGRQQVHVITYAGFGGVPAIKLPWYSTLKDQLIAYISEKHLKDVTLIGHSMGGTLALEIAAALPEKITKVISVDALPCMRDLMMPGVPADKIVYDNPYSKQLLAMNAEAFKANAGMFAEAMTNAQEKRPMLIQWMLDADRETYVYGYTDLLRTDARPGLPDIKAKTLVLAASFPDKATVTANIEKQYAGLPNKEIVIAENSRHFIMFDQADWFYSQVNHFLSK